MTQLTLTSPDERSIKPLVESALRDRARVLDLAIRRAERRLRAFERAHGLSTDEFLARLAQDEYQHSDDRDDWVGESRMLMRLREKMIRLQGIEIVD